MNKQMYSTAKVQQNTYGKYLSKLFVLLYGKYNDSIWRYTPKFNSPSTFLAIQCYNLAHFLVIPSFFHQQLQILCAWVYGGGEEGDDGENSKGLFSSQKRQFFVN